MVVDDNKDTCFMILRKTKRSGNYAWLLALLVLSGSLAHDQTVLAQELDQHCTISVLNRTARVRADGTWILPNVPAGFGPIRARATCVENGVTMSGQSDFFTISSDRMNSIAPFALGATTPIPSSLDLSAAEMLLSDAGATTQLSVTALYADGSGADVTAAEKGTTYTVSRSAVVSVSSEGLLTAGMSGTVVVSAANEGALGLIQIQVRLSGDSDGDEIPDDIEISLGLDPNNPIDGMEDPDRDGLTSAEEVALGTDLFKADTDGDGIDDREESIVGVDGFETSPLLADTDGDGIRDALEISTGTDPTNATSFSLADALDSISSTPAGLVFNITPVNPEASQQLTVLGHLKDGFTLDLTSTARGTTYESSDLLVANFGADDGRIFAGQNGSASITITNSGFSIEVSVLVKSFTPLAISFLAIPGFANNVDVQGDTAYVAAGREGLLIVDVSERSEPEIVATLPLVHRALDVRVQGNLAYVPDGNGGLQVVDVIDPLNPQIIGSVDPAGFAYDVELDGTRAYLANGGGGLEVINISDPTLPVVIGSVDTPGTGTGVAVSADRQLACIADGSRGIQVIDLSDETQPALVGNFDTGNAIEVVIRDGYALVADVESSLTSVNLADPTQPVLGISTPRDTGGLLRDIVLRENIAFGADFFFVNGVPIFDITNAAAPGTRSILDFREFFDDNGTGIAADENYVYLTAASGLSDNGAAGTTRLYIGQYAEIQDTAGIPPTVTITSPGAAAQVVENSLLSIEIEATDDVRVANVVLSIDGEALLTDSKRPYAVKYRVPTGVSQITVGASAVDFGGNVAVALDRVVQVIPDPGTTAQGRVVDRDLNPVDGATVTCAGVRGASLADGSYSIPDVPTAQGDFVCAATVTTPEDRSLSGNVTGITPVAAGVSLVDDITVELGTLYPWLRLGEATHNCVRVHDLDLDSLPDVLLAGNAGLTVYSGRGDGRFEAPETYPTGFGPNCLAIGDLNLDAIPDIVTSNWGSNDVSVLIGLEGGGFTAEDRVPVGLAPRGVALADLNGDSFTDGVVANESSDFLTLLLGRGDGSFTIDEQLVLGIRARGITIADLDLDEIPDIIATRDEFVGQVVVFFSNGDNTFDGPNNFPVGSFPRDVAVADLNRDTFPDIVTTKSQTFNNPTSLSVLYGNGDGSFQSDTAVEIGGASNRVEIADLDGDENLDLVTSAEPPFSDLSVTLGNGDGSFEAPQRFLGGSSPFDVAVGDLNLDGFADLVGATFRGAIIAMGNSEGRFDDQLRFGVGRFASMASLEDVNVDGRIDLVTGNHLGRDFSILLGADGTVFEPQTPVTSPGRPISMDTGDLNADTFPDIISIQQSSLDIAYYLGNGDGSFGERTVVADVSANFLNSATIDDMNNDNRADLIAAESFLVLILLGTGNDASNNPLYAAPQGFAVTQFSQPRAVTTGDLNRDGVSDVMTANPGIASNNANDRVSVFIGNGDGTLQAEQLLTVGANPVSILIQDINSDLHPDILTANEGSGDVSVLLGNGDGTFQDHVSLPVGTVPRYVAAADLDGDSRVDLAVSLNEAVAILRGNPGGGFASPELYTAHTRPHFIGVLDINQNGLPDLVVVHTTSEDVSVLFHR